MDEELRSFRRTDGEEGPRRPAEIVESAEICGGARIRKIQRAFSDAEVVLDESQDATEIVALIIDVRRRGVRGNEDERNAKAVLVVALRLWQNGWRLVIVPTTPVIPQDKDGSVIPISLSIRTLRIIAQRVHDRCHPSWTASVGDHS